MPAVTKESLHVLADLQARDSAIDRLHARLKAIPGEIVALRAEADAEKAKAEGLKAESKRLQVEKKNKEVELATKEEAVLKHQRELNAVKSNDAFKALQREIDAGKEEKGKLEDEVLVLMERVDEAARAEKEEAKREQAFRAEVESKVKVLEAEAERVKAEIESKKAERDGISGQLPDDMVKQYEFLRPKRAGVALAVVRNDVCGGCNIKLRPQTIVEVSGGMRLVLCDGCQRILFKPA